MRKALFLLGILNDSDVEWMAREGGRLEVEAGKALISEGQPIDSVFLVIDGMLNVTVSALPGKVVAKLMAGEVVGEMSFVDSRPPSASVTASEKSLVLSIPRRKLSERLDRDVAFAMRFYRALAVFLADRLRTTTSQLGYGQNTPTQQQIDLRDEIDPDTLERLSLAADRFDQLQRRLRSPAEAGSGRS